MKTHAKKKSTGAVRLSKSKLMAFRQCPKRLWMDIHEPKPPEIEAVDPALERRFRRGHEVGELARLQYPDGILIEHVTEPDRALAQTRELLSSRPRKVLFEAAFRTDGIIVRADLLVPAKGGWHMVEVKSSAKTKDYHLEDAAIQSWVARKAGLPLVATSLQVIDSTWTYPGGNHYSGLLKMDPIDDRIAPVMGEVPTWITAARNVLASGKPAITIGRHCEKPYPCAFYPHCSAGAAEVEMPITWIPKIGAKATTLAEQGITDIRQVDLSTLTEKQRSVASLYIGGREVRKLLSAVDRKRLAGTRHYLDFESVQFAIPRWAGTKPFQQVCFQWSCDVEAPGRPIEHHDFLDLSGDDPSREFAEALIRVLGRKGPVLVYYQSFEIGRLRELAARFADLAPALEAIIGRVVDLHPLTVEHYFHPGLEGSWSIKNVLRTIRPDRAHDMLEEIAEGNAASEGYLEATDPQTPPERKARIRRQLLDYCGRDTEAMIHVLKCLAGE